MLPSPREAVPEVKMESVMTTNMKHAQELIYSADGLGASNFKMFPGSNPEVTPEMVAGELVRELLAIEQENGLVEAAFD
jgi:hypothetical protein